MSRHGKMADDSASICVVVAKQMKDRIHSRRSRIAMRRAQRLEMAER